MGNPVKHFEVVGKDAGLLQQFYAEAFGWEMKQQIHGYAMAHTGSEEGIAGGVGAAMNWGPRARHILCAGGGCQCGPPAC
jgi:predicted enzyme related to lactoylglutathione lyase